MANIRFDRGVCGNAAESFKREWLETNGIGGFASSTIAGVNTRRYHGLLIAASGQASVRQVLLSKLEETLIVGGERYELSTNLYPGAVHPAGYRYLTGFRLDPFPVFTFEAGGVMVEKRLFMVEGENTVAVAYEIASGIDEERPHCRLEVRPLLAFRGYHDLTHANSALNGRLDESEGAVSIEPYTGLPRLHFAHNARAVKRRGTWYYNFEYPRERERGLDFHEDLFCPCMLDFELAPQQPATVIASTAVHRAGEFAALQAQAVASRRAAPLEAAAEQFVVHYGERRSIVAGYPWFRDWGRDTMIALPGLTVATGRFDAARDILRAFADLLDRGMLPNTFPEAGEAPEFNTVDATLWMFEAVRHYLERSGDAAFVRAALYEKLKDVLEWHIRGTRFGIHMDTDGLLVAGGPDTQLTWMDARVNGVPATPRNGKPVEIQGLWYNALRFTARLAGDFGEEAARARYEDLAAKAAHSFNALFWNEEGGYLYDVVDGGDGGRRDASLRPNQAIALSLGYCAIPEDRARRILVAVERSLLTPFGLRTLAPHEPGYRGRYEGSVPERDGAYHQGTVWPWLLGPFLAADLRFNGAAAAQRAPARLNPLREFALSRGVGQIPEIFDGDAPHEPRGCFAQAWSVAEILRLTALTAGT